MFRHAADRCLLFFYECSIPDRVGFIFAPIITRRWCHYPNVYFYFIHNNIEDILLLPR